MTEQRDLETQIAHNLDRISEKIRRSAEQSGRRFEDILLVVVSKKQPVSMVQAARAVGICHFGENYPEQAVEKLDAFAADQQIRWHMIGHLQSRKIKLVVDRFHYLHSLDSQELAVKLDRALGLASKKLPVLLQFNVGDEESKHGWDASDEDRWGSLLGDVEKILQYSHLDVRGLMTMPPLEADPAESRQFFSKLFRLREFLKKNFPERNWAELSMGTSGDFEAAILEGATMIRIGQAILGPRL